ncbi:hypothetical protein [Streptomyces atroolivaceus]|uniref:hypothetical protein n=1 Tax=Streptomyces atroolivaceus TaxID=66869 RepID=UPI002024A5DC|nr:hypothetical protein [Streptomyces atroolivaceus]
MGGERSSAPRAFGVIAVVAEQEDLAFVARVDGLGQLRGDDQEVDQSWTYRDADVGGGCQTNRIGKAADIAALV